MEHHKRHSIIWKILFYPVRLVLRLLYNYSAPVYTLEGPYMVLANHVTDLDPVFVACSFKNQMYFVASEHIYRQGFLSVLLEWALKPIARQKGASAAAAVKNVMRVMKDGGNTAIFPEGNRNWDGVTADFPASTGKLARSCGGSLITYRLRGGYMTSPRWSGNSRRKGKMSGDIVNIYTAEQLRAMTPAEINRHIAEDLYEDAYEIQVQAPVAYPSKKRAEHLESYLFLCPNCGMMHRMHSHGNTFECLECGMTLEYSPEGFFRGEKVPYETVREWGVFQNEKIAEMIEQADENDVIFSDDGYLLRSVHTAKAAEELGTGTLTLRKSGLELPCGICIPPDALGGFSMRGAFNIFLSTKDGDSYELRPQGIRCSVKYLNALRLMGRTDLGV